MIETLRQFAGEHREALLALLDRWLAEGRPILLRSDLRKGFDDVCRERPEAGLAASPLARFTGLAQEGAFRPPWACFALREGAERWLFVRIHLELLVPEEVDIGEFLGFRERFVDADGPDVLEVDFGPFGRGFPRLSETNSIGQGLLFLNRRLASLLFGRDGEGRDALHEFLALHALDGQNLLLRRRFPGIPALRSALRAALGLLAREADETPWRAVEEPLGRLGFAPGWGDTAGRAREMMALLVDLLEAPSPETLEDFLGRVPMITRILVVSPHGYFGQDGVLGLPDTGGQVVYILDQVRALEREMRERLARQGVAVEPQIVVLTRQIPDSGCTTCHEPTERVAGCLNTRILRVPFRKASGEVVRHWISRFEVWPYLERFARDAEREALAALGGRPDLVIGNYSDGNLVATLLAQSLGVTQCNIAHALEKTKYLLSDLYWKDNEARYHFSCQYTADLIAMNAADFIIASTYQEIAGTPETMGQYESYRFFTMPGLYRVLNGIELFDPRFNIVSPGADADVYFSFREASRRFTPLHPKLEALVYGEEAAPDIRGVLAAKEKPLLFTMARLDRIKNVTGFVEWFGASERLRGLANLLVVGGTLDPAASSDAEERGQIERMHELLDRFHLEKEVRWVGRRLDRNLAGELYRFVADRRGVFVQPALFEAFGLTLVEAMACGLPAFATCHGGPSEIVEEGRSGFHIDPNEGSASAETIADFLERVLKDPAAWDRVSERALLRVESRYTWKRYAERMMTLARIYGFWKYVSRLDRQETLRYLQMFYRLQLRPLARALDPEA